MYCEFSPFLWLAIFGTVVSGGAGQWAMAHSQSCDQDLKKTNKRPTIQCVGWLGSNVRQGLERHFLLTVFSVYHGFTGRQPQFKL